MVKRKLGAAGAATIETSPWRLPSLHRRLVPGSLVLAWLTQDRSFVILHDSIFVILREAKTLLF
jgi:hypothetical protein